MIFTKKFVRPSTDTDWYTPSAEFMSHIQTTYIDTGKCIRFREKTLDETGCVITILSEWVDGTDIDAVMADPIWVTEKDREIAWNEGSEILLLEIKKGDEIVKTQSDELKDTYTYGMRRI